MYTHKRYINETILSDSKLKFFIATVSDVRKFKKCVFYDIR